MFPRSLLPFFDLTPRWLPRKSLGVSKQMQPLCPLPMSSHPPRVFVVISEIKTWLMTALKISGMRRENLWNVVSSRKSSPVRSEMVAIRNNWKVWDPVECLQQKSISRKISKCNHKQTWSRCICIMYVCMYVILIGVKVECLEIDRYVERKDCSRLFCSDGRTGEYFPKPQKFIHIRLTWEIQVAGRVTVVVERTDIWSRYDGDGGWYSALDRQWVGGWANEHCLHGRC